MSGAVAIVLTGWGALRVLGLAAGLWRLRRLPDALRREARRACVVRAATTVVLGVFALYAWAQARSLQPKADFVGFLAMVVVVALVVAAATSMMQPKERSSETLDLFTLGLYPHEDRSG